MTVLKVLTKILFSVNGGDLSVCPVGLVCGF